MHLLIVVFFMVCSLIGFLVVMDVPSNVDDVRKVRKWTGIVFLILSTWAVCASIVYCKSEEKCIKKTELKVYDNSGLFQYVVMNNEPINITKRFGRLLAENERAFVYEYDTVCCGIAFPSPSLISTLNTELEEF